MATTIKVPAGGTCGGEPCWRGLGASGFKYRDKTLSHDGVKLLRLKPGNVPGKAQITLLGAGPNLDFASDAPLLPFAQSPKVTVQLTNSDGRCWTTDFSTPAVTNTGEVFTDRGD